MVRMQEGPNAQMSSILLNILQSKNVILDQEVMQDLPSFKDWPTFPQLYIKGELVGGCDITLELFESGELKKMIDDATAK